MNRWVSGLVIGAVVIAGAIWFFGRSQQSNTPAAGLERSLEQAGQDAGAALGRAAAGAEQTAQQAQEQAGQIAEQTTKDVEQAAGALEQQFGQ